MRKSESSFDFVIVGGGSAGSVVARRLVEETDASVLVLENGGADTDAPTLYYPARWVENIGSSFDYGYGYSPHPSTHDRQHPLSRGKLLGGSGAINALVWTRGHEADYDEWAAAGNTGWDFESVLPLFKRSEDWEDGESRLRGSGGPVHVERAKDLHPVATALIDAGRSLGMPYLDDVTVAAPEGVGPVNLNVRHGRRVNPWDAYVTALEDSSRLTVVTGAKARKVLVSRGRCTGVEYVVDGEPVRVSALTEVVLSAGAIDTPRLLMLSGIGPASDLREAGIDAEVNLPGVGRNLQEHPILASLCFEANASLPPLNNNLEGSVAFCRSRPEVGRPDLMFVALQIPYVTPEIGARFTVPPNSFSIAPGLSRPQSRGYVRIREGGELEIQPNMLQDEADVAALVRGVEIGFDMAAGPGFREITKRLVAPGESMTRSETVSFIRDAATPYFHPVGTCAMGAVVDAELRVHGVDGLRIADASVMPTLVSSYPHATTVMIGEFASRLLTT
ncbi:choline dehydrogenase [Streptomyces sp. HNM0575]|uniref:GMC family oxidoreductase n=1 Tax=Streptomyces sp. HNM0575 TaxID=2716338 RepID=UPI00145FB756|nr:GMC family oxidoreductase N-terminal domain-containing protein [Streptomyces sp. HNM0575]NLU75274.1 choline dehydrogenase [Streptomyces sp. HNM0575]